MNLSYAKELFDYDPLTGIVAWKSRPRNHFASKRGFSTWNSRYSGTEISGVSAQGYNRVCVDYARYLLHRVVWLVYHGEWPSGQIDHINGVRTDNRIANLRCVTASGNAKNQGIKSTNKSGVSGVSWCKRTQKWQASITVDYKTRFLGRFHCLNDAKKARDAAKIECRFHKNHGDKR